MALDLYETFSSARLVIDAADAALGFSLSQLMFHGPEAELTDTVNAQPALLAHGIAALAALQQAMHNTFPSAALCAGHSLGEYSAFVAAGALDLSEGIKLVRARGEAMKRAGQARPGAMAAILGLDDAKLFELAQRTDAVQVANYNAPGQIVISGERQAIEGAVNRARTAGAKRAIVLAVSIASHCELMEPAVQDFRSAVNRAEIRTPRIPIVSNITARPLPDAEAIREEMLGQLTQPVQWVQSVEWMERQGVTEFFEFGPKDVLAGLNKRIASRTTTRSLGTVENIEKYVQGQFR
jgi:[acyl-carrier-protein] S-malonyltransferase